MLGVTLTVLGLHLRDIALVLVLEHPLRLGHAVRFHLPLQPGALGTHLQRLLAPHRRQLAPCFLLGCLRQLGRLGLLLRALAPLRTDIVDMSVSCG